MFNAFDAQQRAQSAATINGIVQRNLNNPAVMAGYRQHLAQGGRMTPQEYAYKYAATGGFTAQGYQNYANTSAQIHAQQQAAVNSYWAAQEQNRLARQAMHNAYSANRQEAGRGLMGQQTYYDQSAGRNVPLNYLPSAQPTYDYDTGRYYAQGQNGQYYSSTGNGYWTPISPAR
jgi:hypothetical protein